MANGEIKVFLTCQLKISKPKSNELIARMYAGYIARCSCSGFFICKHTFQFLNVIIVWSPISGLLSRMAISQTVFVRLLWRVASMNKIPTRLFLCSAIHKRLQCPCIPCTNITHNSHTGNMHMLIKWKLRNMAPNSQLNWSNTGRSQHIYWVFLYVHTHWERFPPEDEMLESWKKNSPA